MAVSSASAWSDNTDIIASSTAVRLKSVRVRQDPDSATAAYIQLFNSADATPGSTTPNDVVYLPAPASTGRRAEFNFNMQGKYYATGLTWGVFTTATGGTASTTGAPLLVEVHYAPGG
jgi:hypothetical protein